MECGQGVLNKISHLPTIHASFQGCRVLVAISSSHWAGGGVHPGQVVIPLQTILCHTFHFFVCCFCANFKMGLYTMYHLVTLHRHVTLWNESLSLFDGKGCKRLGSSVWQAEESSCICFQETSGATLNNHIKSEASRLMGDKHYWIQMSRCLPLRGSKYCFKVRICNLNNLKNQRTSIFFVIGLDLRQIDESANSYWNANRQTFCNQNEKKTSSLFSMDYIYLYTIWTAL